MLLMICPNDLIVPLLDSLGCRIERSSIISSGFCESDTTSSSTSIFLLNLHLNTSIIIWTYGASDYTEGIIITLTRGDKF